MEPGDQSIRNDRLHLIECWQRHPGVPTFAGDAGDRTTGKPTGNDQIEVREIWIDIERQPMHRRPARDADADRRNLPTALTVPIIRVPTDPNPGRAGVPPRNQAKGPQRIDQHLFKKPDPTVDPNAEIVEIDHRIHHELSGTVIRDIPTTIGLVPLDAMSGENFGRGQDIFDRPWPPGDRHHRRIMLEEQDESPAHTRPPRFQDLCM